MVLLSEGDQTDPNIFKDIPLMDVIIDDASHISYNSIKTFNILKDKLNIGGIYIIEDVWEEQLKEYSEEFLKQFNDDDYVILKLDVEGSEYDILDQLIETKLITKINELYVEFHDGFFNRDSSIIKNKLKEFNIKCDFNWM